MLQVTCGLFVRDVSETKYLFPNLRGDEAPRKERHDVKREGDGRENRNCLERKKNNSREMF